MSGFTIPQEQIGSDRPELVNLKRHSIALIVLVVGIVIVALFLWDWKEEEAVAQTPPARQGFGSGLDGRYVAKEEPNEPEAKAEPKTEPKKAGRVIRRELASKTGDAIANPAQKVAEAKVAGWIEDGSFIDMGEIRDELRAGPGCVVADGTTFDAQKSGGVIVLTRPLLGTDGATGRDCDAAREGSELRLALVEDEQLEGNRLCAIEIRTTDPGRPVFDLGCWDVYQEHEGRGRWQDGALYRVRVVDDTAFADG